MLESVEMNMRSGDKIVVAGSGDTKTCEFSEERGR